MKHKLVLVTGAGGAIGGSLKDIASTEFPDHDFIFATRQSCDLTDKDATLAYIHKEAPDAIIHLAAVAGGVGANKLHPATLLRDNVRMDMNVLEAARQCGVGKVIMTLSSGTYPPSAPLPLNEDSLHSGYPDESNYGYAFAKRLIDPMIRAYQAEYDLNVIGLLPNNTIGEHSSFSESNSGVVPALIRRFFENRDNGSELVVWGDGSPLREISYAKDIARIYMWCLDNYNEAQVLNVGTTEEISIRDIAHEVAVTLGIDPHRIVFDETKPSGPWRKSTDNTRLAALYPFDYRPVRETIAAVTTYFSQQYAKPEMLRL